MQNVSTLNELIKELKKYAKTHGDKPLMMFQDPEGNGIFTSQFVGLDGGEVILIPDERTNIAY